MDTAAAPLSIHPQLSQAKELLANAKYEQAAQVLIGFLRGHRNHPQALAMLGQTASRVGALGQAEQFLRQAIAAGARDFDTRRQLAAVVSQQERPAQAIPLFEALAQESGDAGIRAIHAGMLEKLGHSEQSRQLYRQLTEDAPDNPMLWNAYGHSLRSNGQVDEAIAAYRRALAIDDGFGEAWWGLASIKRKVFDDADIAAMRAALAIAIDERNIAPLNFALARALHDRADYAGAFAHYRDGNAIRAESLRYNADELSDEVAEIERTVDAAFLGRLAAAPVGDQTPVFIISLPRSGSTLLEQMLGSHSHIEPAGELPYVAAILRSYMEMATRRGRVTVTQAIAAMPDEQAAALGREYLARAALHRRTDSALFTDKLPQNWSNVLFIRRILPQARFIDIRRPAMDCCFSNFTQSFTSAHPASFTLTDVGRAYVDNVRLMAHFARVAPGMIHHVDYSQLLDEPRSQLGGVLSYLGLDWEDGLLEFHRLDRVVRTPSSEQVRRPLNRDGVDVWKPYSEWLAPLRETLGELAGE